MSAYEINWDDTFLPLYGNSIMIPANTIIWRGFDPKYEPISDRPAYYGSKIFAQGYAEKYGTNATPFITSRPLNLLDIRFMKVLLSQLFEHNHTSQANRIIQSTTISFGLCSLQHQITLFKDLYKAIYASNNPSYIPLKEGIKQLESIISPDTIYEQKGVRIAETTNDAIVMGFLKELFSGQYDGYISPNIYTPFHVEKKGFILNSELVLFNPKESGIQLLRHIPKSIQKQTINGCILSSGYNYTTIKTRGMTTSYYINTPNIKNNKNSKKIGGYTVITPCDDYNHLYEKGDKQIQKLYNEGVKQGIKWRNKSVSIYSSVAPGPEVDPSIFDSANS
jgi:hypothetical protein